MTSKKYEEAFVWVWLPEEVEPVVAGKLTLVGKNIVFNYGKSYLGRADKISLHKPELPLKPGVIEPLQGLNIPSCIRDSSPDAWGRRVIINRKFGKDGNEVDTNRLDELTYLLESGSDRIGFLDFQGSATKYQPRTKSIATLKELMDSAKKVEEGVPLSDELDQALNHGTSIGGARPKALIEDNHKKYIAKFSSSTDVFNVIKSEFIGMTLASRVGINVANVILREASGKDVILVERFDRIHTKKGWTRRGMVSALTLLELNEMMARHSSYEDFADKIRQRVTNPAKTLKELYMRLVFNILVGNTDDHARNHSMFWDGKNLELTPAYDICPQARTGNTASQGMLILGQSNSSQLSLCLDACDKYLLTKEEASKIIETLLEGIVDNWLEVCELAKLSQVDRSLFSNNQFLNPFIFEGLEEAQSKLIDYRKAFLDLNKL